ncbi:MAG TPA: NAD-dependent epimerase/dehydratase family protein [Solirubrobacteraceae bacterium]|nr:NAD-dependent epimerase/dehydratase family protein [Solirubrobacteraceae bacterium]
MNILVTGITGYVGSRLAPRLTTLGHSVRGFSRGAHPSSSWPIVQGDAVSGKGLTQALADVQVAYYLMHSLEPSPDGAFGTRELRAAQNFVRAAQAAGTERIVYLGGLMPAGGPTSPHLTSRLAVERILLESVDCALALRASIVIGAGSRSFRLLVRLVERMPILPLPGWHVHRTSPVDERDMIEILARMATAEGACGQALDVAGPEQVSYGELVERIRDMLLLGRPTVTFRRLNVTPIVSRLAALIGQEEYELVGPLMESLEDDLLPRTDGAAELVGVRLHSLDSAIEHALAEWEAVEPLAAR